MPVTYKNFQVRHPEYDAAYWRVLDALYAGGRRVLRDKKLMEDVFPKHNAELDRIYQERCARAMYIPYAGHVVDGLVGELFKQQVAIHAEPEAEPFWADFWADCSELGGRKLPFNDLLKEQLRTALKKQCAWTLVDLPKPPVGEPAPASLADQENQGLLRLYATPIEPECVLDWEEDRTGALVWALIVNVTQRRAGLDVGREKRREEYTYYTRTAWTRYLYEYDVKTPPKADEEPLQTDSGPLSFGRVPLPRLQLPAGLWLMDRIESIVRAHFNQRNALSWGQFKTLFPVLTARLAKRDKGDVPVGKAADHDRATNQVLGPGYAWVGVEGDELAYIGPDAGPFEFAGQDLDRLRDEIYRVVTMMIHSVPNTGAALGRSAESKQQDKSATAVLLEAFGDFMRKHAVEICETGAAGRQEPESRKWAAKGQEKYDNVDIGALVDQAVMLESVSIPSAAFQVEHKLELAERRLGDKATPELIETIRKELEANITNEQFAPVLPDPTLDPDADADPDANPTVPPPGAKPPKPARPGASG